jgi:antitoxin component YwqK of YwqJK toxin-antitoxin module
MKQITLYSAKHYASKNWGESGLLYDEYSGYNHGSGIKRKYFTTGIIAYEAKFVRGNIEGFTRAYHISGLIEKQMYYVHGVAEGNAIEYCCASCCCTSFSLFLVEPLCEGYTHGLRRRFFHSGIVSFESLFEYGEKTKYTAYHSDGSPDTGF